MSPGDGHWLWKNVVVHEVACLPLVVTPVTADF